VHQLVPDRVAELGVAPPERQRHAALQEFRDPEQPFGRDEGKDVCLLEVGMRRVHDEWNAPQHGVVEPPLERIIALFRVRQRDAAELFFFGIVVEIDVLAAQHAPIEPAVLNLVLPEVAELGAQRSAAGHEDGKGADDRFHHL
jgi:hypothetical protein